MIRRIPMRAIFAATFATLATLAHAQLAPDEALKTFQLADDVRIELVAAEPLVMSPCAIAFDERGRLFVAENRGYPNMANPPQGTIALLEDTDGDGRMDKRTVFADGLTYPNGVLPWRGGVIVTCAPDVLFFKDTDGDGKADERKVLLTGFDAGKSTQLRVNAPTLGPDGWIYLAAGLAGGTITCPEHPERAPLKMTADVRFHPDTLAVESVDGRSQYGMSFDDFGRRFICMNRVPVQHVVLSSKMIARNPRLAFSETVQDCNERSVRTGLKGGGDGVKLFPISANLTTADSHSGSFSAACGVMVWRGGALPHDAYRRAVFSCDPTGNLVHADTLQRRDSTFAAVPMFKGREFLASRDDWFRPVFLASGPDGALYIADMYRQVIEHPDYLPEEIRKRTKFEAGREMGRIWRVRGKDMVMDKGALADASTEQLSDRLVGPNGWTRETARRLLVEKGRGPEPLVFTAPSKFHRNNPRWFRVCHTFAPLSDGELESALAERIEGSDEAVLEILAEDLAAGRRGPALLVKMGAPPRKQWDFDVLRYVLALGEVRDDAVAVPLLVKACEGNHGERWMIAALISSSAGREMAVLRGLLANPENKGSLPSFEPLSTMYAETLGRADSKREIDSIETLLGMLAGYDYSARALMAAAYAKGRGIRLTVSCEAMQTLLRETGVAVSHSERVPDAAITLLAQTSWVIGGGTLLKAATSGSREALRALANFDNPLIPRELLRAASLQGTPFGADGKAIPRGVAIERLAELATVCLARESFHGTVLDAIEEGSFPLTALTAQQKQRLRESKEPSIRERAAKLFAQPAAGDRMKAYDEAKKALALIPLPAHGREVFRNVCASCHRLDREGHDVGPDLFDIRNQPKENILFHIIAPDAEIAPAFAAYACETKDGRAFAGVLTSETAASVTIRQPGGIDETVLRADVKSLTALPSSLMPASLADALSPQALADLLAFLKGER